MAARTVDPAFFPVLSYTPADSDSHALIDRQIPLHANNLGAFRGLAFALIFEGMAIALGVACWEVIHRLL
ncbi:MAG TPA: hypothetical protein VHX60_12900 [Acidobacteriaceae bacterium]|jgi:hypothetical protein|nr:hypothetical protein [Acidobacteriaceae bacterium]